MVVNRKPTGLASSMPVGFLIGTAAAWIWSAAGAALTGYLIINGTLPEQAVGYGALIILITGSYLTAAVSYRKIKHRRAAVCMGAGGIYFLTLLAANAMFFGGQYTGVGVTALAVVAGCATAALMGMGKGRKQKYTIGKH